MIMKASFAISTHQKVKLPTRSIALKFLHDVVWHKLPVLWK